MIKNIIFDLGNVFIEWDPRKAFRGLIAPENMERFMREVWRDEWNDNLDRGITLADNTRSLCEKYPAHAVYITCYHEHWRETLGAVNAGSVALLADLKRAGLRAYALSNWSAETFPSVRAEHSFFDLFDDIVISGDVGLCKPGAEIYQLLLKRHGLLPGECAFIDDRPDNVAAAARLGIAGIQFQTATQVREELEARGVLKD
ncbi:MAG: HAD family phosphatase [Opitutaceae bacterium]|jgi:2-haloacid dehalogenase|nr:HAD family phosphatase [Opitutaceae bacterium]